MQPAGIHEAVPPFFLTVASCPSRVDHEHTQIRKMPRLNMESAAASLQGGEHVGDRPIAVLSMHPGWVRTAMGGPDAPLAIEESVAGLADVIEASRPPGHHFIDYQGAELPW